MSADIPAPAPAVSVSTHWAPSSARRAARGSGPSLTDVWVRQQHHSRHRPNELGFAYADKVGPTRNSRVSTACEAEPFTQKLGLRTFSAAAAVQK